MGEATAGTKITGYCPTSTPVDWTRGYAKLSSHPWLAALRAGCPITHHPAQTCKALAVLGLW